MDALIISSWRYVFNNIGITEGEKTIYLDNTHFIDNSPHSNYNKNNAPRKGHKERYNHDDTGRF